MIHEGILQLCKFAIVGFVNTFIDWAVYFTILKIFPSEIAIFYTAAKSFSYFCGIINSFFLNRCWTFKTDLDGNGKSRFFKFTVVNAIGLGINSVSFYVLLNVIGSHAITLFLATSIAFGFNFSLSKLWVFRKGKTVAKTTGG
ncbi:MAG: GtrA-like protein [Pelotomaculum sp. PtaU1.Bin035]|nr:MAG: GtrA-like protein [Pelotomaculum sp. PtaU1.Bin035]